MGLLLPHNRMQCTLSTDCCKHGDNRYVHCLCTRKRLVILASGLQLKLGLGLVLLGVGGLTRLPTALLWPTLAAIVCGLLSIALSYSTLLAYSRSRTLLAAGYTGWVFALLFLALAAECLVHVAGSWPSVRAFCETHGDAPCLGATVDEVGAYCALAARGAVGMSMLMLSWGIVQQWLRDVREKPDPETAHTVARWLGGSLALAVVAGGAALTCVAAMMAKQIQADSWHPAVTVAVGGVAGLGLVSSLVGALAWRRSSRQLWAADPPYDAEFWLERRTVCSLSAEVPRFLAGVWICLSTVLFSWSFVDHDAKTNFEGRWAAYASAWPDLTARYCAEVLDDAGSEHGEALPPPSLSDAAYDGECADAGFREAQSLYRLAGAAIGVGFFMQILIVRLLRREISTGAGAGDRASSRRRRENNPMGLTSSYPGRPVRTPRRGLQGFTRSSPSTDHSPDLDRQPV